MVHTLVERLGGPGSLSDATVALVRPGRLNALRAVRRAAVSRDVAGSVCATFVAGLPAELVRRLGVVPSYYLHYFYDHDAVVEHQRDHQSRAEEVADIERQLLELYADERLAEKPELLSRRGGAFYSEAAVELLASLFGRGPSPRHVVNLRNNGALPFLADDAVVEVAARVGPDGMSVVDVPPLDPVQRGLVAHVSAYEELALDAALRGGRERVFRALLAHPLIGQADVAETLADRMIEVNREYLPWA